MVVFRPTPGFVYSHPAHLIAFGFGATDGYRFVNGALEKIAAALRPEEFARTRTNA